MRKEDILKTLISTIKLDEKVKFDFIIDEDIIPYMNKHRIEGAFYNKYINKLIDCNIQEEVLRDFRLKYEYYNLRDAYIKDELRKLAVFLDEEKVEYRITKGVVLSEKEYARGVRYYGDIDLLVKKEDLNQVKKVMQKAGYEQGRLDNWRIKIVSESEIDFFENNTHQTIPFVKITSKTLIPICVDVNFEMSSEEAFENPKFIEFMFESIDYVTINGHKYPTLQMELLFINVCINAYRDAMSLVRIRNNKDIYLYQYLDIYTILHQNVLNKHLLLDIIQKFGLEEVIYFSISNLQSLVLSNIGEEIIQRLHVDKKVLNRFGGKLDNEKGEWLINFKDRILMKTSREHMKFSKI